ncbi:MAG: hypothetical protein ACR2IQ_01115 [Minisyncoccia bacterium]
MPKIFASEHVYSYKHYTFGYTIYAQRINSEPIENIYESGFLPYTGEYKSDIQNLYYMARSARIQTKTFTLSSENRRIIKKFQSYEFIIKEYNASTFIKNEVMLEFCLDYFNKRHGPNTMTKERLVRILSYSKEINIVEYTNKETRKPCAYVIEIQGETISHYWFSFYDLSLTYLSFGMWLMLDRTINAQNTKKQYYYIGTVYGDKALYKTNLPSLEYWNGQSWVINTPLLKKRARTDLDRNVNQIDEFKEI